MSCSLTNPYFHHPSFILAVVSEALKSLFMTLGLPTVSAAHGMEVRARWYHNLISTKYNFPLEVVSGYCHNWCMMMMAATMKMKKTKIMWLLTNGNPGWYYGVARPDWGPEEISHPGFLPHRCQPGGDVPNIIQFYQIKLFSHGCQFSTRCGHRAMCCLI